MTIDLKGLAQVMREANELSSKAKLTGHEERRLSYLMSAASAIKSGVTLEEVEIEHLNEHAGEPGIKHVRKSPQTREQRQLVTEMKRFIDWTREQRDSVEGVPLTSQLGTYSGLGYFVPTDFWNDMFQLMRAADPLLDDADVTCINSNHGRPMPIPTLGDLKYASVVGEGNDEGEDDPVNIGHATIGAWQYKSPRFVVSQEAFQDMSGGISTIELFKRFAAQRLQLGIGADLLKGSGTNKPTGLLTALIALGRAPITATGSSGNTGGSETGATSIGQVDLVKLFLSVNSAYRSSAKCAWLMADSTLQSIESVVAKFGQPLGMVKYIDGQPYILGKPVKISPSMPAIAASANTIVFGDLSYFVTRIVTEGEGIGIKAFTEAPNLVENGKVAFRAFVRADGVLAVTDANDDCPLAYLQQHS